MAKQHEIAYAERMNPGHAANKPFSDQYCGPNLIRIGTIMTLLPPAPARVLDLGCGTGWTSLFLARAGYQVVGVDIAPEMIRIAEDLRDAAGLTNLTFRVSDYEHLGYRDQFDAALFFDALHHAEDEALALRCAHAALKPGGVCVADEPGAGHAAADGSRAAVAEYGVTEKDMPPEYVVRLGRAAGFTGFRVFPHAHELSRVTFRDRAAPAADPFAEADPRWVRWMTEPKVGLWTRLARRLALLRTPSPAWRLPGVDHLLLHTRSNGLVVLHKGAEAARAAA